MRRIVSTQMQASRAADGSGENVDGFFDRIIKYIPSDIVAAWVALTGLMANIAVGVMWGVLAVMTLLAFLWTKKQTDVPGQPPAWRQALVAAVSFVVWAFALHSGPFATLNYAPAYGSIALIIYTLAIGLIP
jgi:uncharacterized membrane-anchored protein